MMRITNLYNLNRVRSRQTKTTNINSMMHLKGRTEGILHTNRRRKILKRQMNSTRSVHLLRNVDTSNLRTRLANGRSRKRKIRIHIHSNHSRIHNAQTKDRSTRTRLTDNRYMTFNNITNNLLITRGRRTRLHIIFSLIMSKRGHTTEGTRSILSTRVLRQARRHLNTNRLLSVSSNLLIKYHISFQRATRYLREHKWDRSSSRLVNFITGPPSLKVKPNTHISSSDHFPRAYNPSAAHHSY